MYIFRTSNKRKSQLPQSILENMEILPFISKILKLHVKEEYEIYKNPSDLMNDQTYFQADIIFFKSKHHRS